MLKLLNKIGIVFGCFLLTVCIFILYHTITGISLPFPQKDTQLFDIGHYDYIRQYGYGEPYRTAFFPLFPFFWGWSGLGIVQISILNTLIWIFALGYLSCEFKFNILFTIFAGTLPFTFFYYIPYTESFFFLFTTLALIGINRQSSFLLCIGLFFAGMTRASFFILLPALIITATLTYKNNSIFSLKKIIFPILSLISAQFLVMLIHYYQVGDFFSFWEAQKVWGHRLQMIHIPLKDWNSKMIYTDAHFFYIGVFAISLILLILLNKLTKNQFIRFRFLQNFNHTDAIWIFSTLYLAGLTGLVVLHQGEDVHSLGRYVCCQPFILLFLWKIKAHIPPFNKKVLIYMSGILAVTGIFTLKYYLHISSVLQYILLISYWAAFYIWNTQTGRNSKIAWFILVSVHLALGLFFQLLFFNREWVE